MPRRLPPLNALRAFEAAARLSSFTLAARALFVTPGAISQQVKALEEALGQRLFLRRTRAVALTEAGRTLLPAVQEAFALLSRATAAMRERERAGPLTVSVLPSFAVKWLVPRLARFRARHPEIDVRIVADRTLANFRHDGVDVAIRHGFGEYAGMRSVWLMAEDLFPVCSPALAKALRGPASLRLHALLHDETTRDWEVWLQMAGLTGIDGSKGPVFGDAIMTIQAAIEGHGVALTRGELVEREMATGQLVQPFAIRMPAAFASYVVCPEETAELPKIAAFRAWLLEEAANWRRAARGPDRSGTRLDGAMPLHCAEPAPKTTRNLRRKPAVPGPEPVTRTRPARSAANPRALARRQGKPGKRRGRG